MDKLPFKQVLVLAPHTDDGEFGAGGMISRLLREGATVKYVAFSDCRVSIPSGFEPDTLKKEMLAATATLGIADVQLLDYEVRYFPRDRQYILEDLVKLNKSFAPDLVLLPTTADIHQDHATISQEGLRAFKRCSILGYELPWNAMTLPSQTIVALADQDVTNKITAVAAYKSQRFRTYASADYLRALALTRGVRIGVEYAEAFEPIRIIL